MTIKSHTITFSLGKAQTAAGFLIAQSDIVIGWAFADPMGRFTFFSVDSRLKELEKLVFRAIEDIEGSIMTYLDRASQIEPRREPIRNLTTPEEVS